MRPTVQIALTALALTMLPLQAAQAWDIKPEKWQTEHVNNRFNRQNNVQNGRFLVTAGTLTARSQKPSGGYYYNPVCKTADGRIGAASPTTFTGSRWRWKCLGTSGGKVIGNGSDFTWEYMAQLPNRGSISIYSLTFEVDGKERVLCKGKVGSEELPGYFTLPSPGGIPGACQVLVMGRTVAAKTFWVARRKASGTGQPALSSGAGWIDRPNYNNGPQADPLYRTTTRDGSAVICRAQDGGKWWPGVLVQKSFGHRKPGFACSAFMGTGTTPREFFDYQIHVSSRRASKFDWERNGSQTNFSKGVVLDPGSGASTRRYVCQVGTSKVGYVDGTKKCRTRLNPSGNTKFRLHIK